MSEATVTPQPDQVRDRFTGPMFFRAWGAALLSSCGWALSDMADAMVLGHHMGTVGLAAIALILPTYMINYMFALGLGMGGAMEYAKQMALGNVEEARRNARAVYTVGLLLSMATAVLGLIFIVPILRVLGTTPADGALFEATRAYLQIQFLSTPLFYFSNIFGCYLRNEGLSRVAGIGAFTGNICDMAMNFVFVLGMGLGTAGAAMASAVGYVISLAFFLPAILRKDLALRPGRPSAGWLREGLQRLSRGLSVHISYLYQMIFYLIANNLLMRLGGEPAIAVFDVLQNTFYLVSYLYEGTARAMQPIMTTYYGEHNVPGQVQLFRIGFGSGILLGTAVITVILIFPQLICLLFGLAGSAVEPLAFRAIRIFVFGVFFAGISILGCNFFNAVNYPRLAFFLQTLRGAVVLIPTMLLCATLGLENFWWLFPITEFLSLVIVIVRIAIRRNRVQLQRIEPERIFRRTILSNDQDIGQVSRDLEEFCERFNATPRQAYTVMMTVEELGEAILKHGFQNRRDGFIQVTVVAREDGEGGSRFELHMRDDALAFDPFSLKGGKIYYDDDSLDATGILMIRKRVRNFNYHRFQGFNSLIITV